MAASPSTEHPARRVSPAERIVLAGALAIVVSLLMPWYGLAFRGLSATGLDSFGFAQAAIVLTVGAAALLIAREATGHELPRPLRAGELVVVAGLWAAVLTVYLIADRPDRLGRAGEVAEVQVRYGIYVCLAGAIAMAIGGMRMRVERRTEKRAEAP